MLWVGYTVFAFNFNREDFGKLTRQYLWPILGSQPTG